MILVGKNIVSNEDVLSKVPVAQIWRAIQHPNSDTEAQVRQLRIVRNIDPKRYHVLKRQLPYFVCGIFSPPYRRGENFAYIEYFILDIDKISEKQLFLKELRSRIERDNRVVMCFVSPSEDGLKVMFKLSERCYDKGLFSLFYKAFALQFARQYDIEQVVDKQTCDVTRACFASVDPKAYYNADAETVILSNYVNQDDPTELFDTKIQIEQEWEESAQQSVEQPVDKHDVDSDIIRNIKAILNPQAVSRQPKQVFVPEQLNEIMEDLKNYITQTGVVITEVINISYGKKIRMRMRLKQAEVNLFYGRRGFSVVKSPRSGTDAEFNDLAVELVQSFIYQYN